MHNPSDGLPTPNPSRRGHDTTPRRLGFGVGNPAEGLCIGFGWHGCGTVWQAYARAARAGHALARLIEHLGELSDRDVHIIAHSMGARVALRGIAKAQSGDISRVVLMAAAEFQDCGRAAATSAVGRHSEFVNISSRENDLFDALLEWGLRPGDKTRSLGAGLGTGAANWLDVQIDNPRVRAGLAGFGFPVAPPTRRICHWSGYLRAGALPFYRALIRNADTLTLPALRAGLYQTPDPRWSRLFHLSGSQAALFFRRNPSL